MNTQLSQTEDYRIIQLVVNSTRLISERVKILQKKGFRVEEKAMGTANIIMQKL